MFNSKIPHKNASNRQGAFTGALLYAGADSSKYEDVDLTEFFLSADQESESIVYKDDTMAIYFETIEYTYDDAENAYWAGYVLKR